MSHSAQFINETADRIFGSDLEETKIRGVGFLDAQIFIEHE
jgi:hypothetical protein